MAERHANAALADQLAECKAVALGKLIELNNLTKYALSCYTKLLHEVVIRSCYTLNFKRDKQTKRSPANITLTRYNDVT